MNYQIILKLATLFNKLASYEDEALKKRLTDPKANSIDSYHEMILQKYNIMPIVTKRVIKDWDEDKGKPFYKEYETSLLGLGAYNRVYEVMYEGKLAVAKITRPDRQDEIIKAEKIKQIRPSFGELKKHLPEIYAIIINRQYGIYISIIEKLRPLNSHIMELLFGSPEIVNKEKKIDVSRLSLMLDTGTLDRLLRTLFDNIHDTDANTIKKIKNLMSITLRKEIPVILQDKNALNKINDYLEGIINKLQQSVLSIPEVNKRNKYEIYSSILKLDRKLRTLISRQTILPESAYNMQRGFATVDVAKVLPESRSLMRALIKLRDQYGISWDDLHYENIMERPSTGDLVISDFGNFTIA